MPFSINVVTPIIQTFNWYGMLLFVLPLPASSVQLGWVRFVLLEVEKPKFVRSKRAPVGMIWRADGFVSDLNRSHVSDVNTPEASRARISETSAGQTSEM